MPSVPIPPHNAGAGRRSGACVWALTLLSLLSGNVRAELLGTHPHRDGTVSLMTNLCRAGEPSAGQRAQQTVRGHMRQGCWGINRAGNPIVTWSDGSELELDGDKVKLSRRMAALLEDRAEPTRSRGPGHASNRAARPHGAVSPAGERSPPPLTATGPRDFARPAWCPNAHFPHERMICADAELADRDLRLASLWKPYRLTLSRGAEAWHKSDYFRRLKTCGADKACIVREQEAQMRLYRESNHQ